MPEASTFKNGIIDPNDRDCGILVKNTSRNDILIMQGMPIGSLEELSKIKRVKHPIQKSFVNYDHLKPLFLQIEAANLKNQQKQKASDLLAEFQNVFSKHEFDIGCFKDVQHPIDTGSAKPIKLGMRRTPLNFHEEKAHLQKMIECGAIEPSSNDWASAPVLVRKEDGKVRWCMDYGMLNKCTVKDAFPLPLIEDCFNTLEGAKLLSSFDLSSGYWQLEVAPEDRHKTAFFTKYGLLQHARTGFGLCNAPVTFHGQCKKMV